MPATLPTREALSEAFAQFNDTSRILAESYCDLEHRVSDLTRQLAQSDQARLRALEAREQLSERLEALLQCLPGGVVVLDPEGRVLECNPSAGDMLGEATLGTPWAEVARRVFVSGELDEFELADGRRVSLARRAMSDGGTVLLLSDVTAARALQRQQDRQQRLVAMGEMSARLAHELRTPLATAVLHASRLATGTVHVDDSPRLAGKILERLRLLQRLLDSTLAFVRGEREDGESFDVAALLTETLSIAGLHAEDDGLRVMVEPATAQVLLSGQRALLAGALAHVLNNACEACGSPAGISIAVQGAGALLKIIVQDPGPGIPSQHAAHIFEPFYTTRRGGTGLGLAVARSVARAHGGELRWVAEEGPGTRFELSLPVISRAMAGSRSTILPSYFTTQCSGEEVCHV